MWNTRGKIDWLSSDITPYATVKTYYWAKPRDPDYALDRQLLRGYRDDRENGREEVGLFLDLDGGTLSCYGLHDRFTKQT